MNEDKLKSALAEVCEGELFSEPECDAIPDSYTFSDSFERKMQLALGQQEAAPPRKGSIKSRMKLALVIAAVFSVGFLLGMAREPIWNFITQKTDGGRKISFNTSAVDDPYRRITEIYTLTGIDGDYKLLNTERTFSSAMEIWVKQGENTENAEDLIFFSQYMPAAYTDAFIPDEADNGYYIDDDGTQYYISEGENYTAVIWYNGDYVMLLSGGKSKEEMLSLSKTVKMKQTVE